MEEGEDPIHAAPNAEEEQEGEEEDQPPQLLDPLPEEEIEEANVDDEPQQAQTTTRSGRAINAPTRMEPTWKGQSYLQTNEAMEQPDEVPNPDELPTLEYDPEDAIALAIIICHFRDHLDPSSIRCEQSKEDATQFVITYSLNKGLKKFGARGEQSVMKEMKQLVDRECFNPIEFNSLTPSEKAKALESLIFITEKRDGTVKARQCADGRKQRDWLQREMSSSPTVSTESTLLTAMIEAEEERHVITGDVPNAFIQTDQPLRDKEGDRTIMKMRGALVVILCNLIPEYQMFVVWENGQPVLYMHVTKAIYGLIESSLLFYKKWTQDLKAFGFEINPYDPCVANKMTKGTQMTVSWHVDDFKASHKDIKELRGFASWVQEKYGTLSEVKINWDKVHDYLGMKLDYRVKGQVTIDMIDYVDSMVQQFPQECLQGPTVASPWNENLFKVHDKSPLLPPERAEQYHSTTAQGLFLCKRARPDITAAIAYHTTRVRSPNRDDWAKLVRMMKWLKQTRKDCLTLRSDGTRRARWYADASFAIHADYRSHTGVACTLGQGSFNNISRKQGINTRSSTEAELVTADEAIGPMLWTGHFLEAQGYPLKENILYQDNRSAILLETNGRKSAGKRSRHLNIRYFFVADQVEKGHIRVDYCPTDDMWGDYHTKPTHGAKFKKFRDLIMNLPVQAQLMLLGCLK
jgi:hypothetical protein